jgi:hypothetical protein
MSEREVDQAEQLPGPAGADAVHRARLEIEESRTRCTCPRRLVVFDADPLKLQIRIPGPELAGLIPWSSETVPRTFP